MDIFSDELMPTWRNGSMGSDCILKRLDRAFLASNMLRIVGRFRLWVAYPYIFDHAPIFLQLDGII